MKPKKIGKGQPLSELVKGSLNYTMERLRHAFRNQFRNEDLYWNWYLCEIFADHVIVCDDQLPPDEFYKVAYTQEGESYLFAARDAWEIVELAYQSRAANEHRKEIAKKGGQIQLVERLDSTRIELMEAEEGKPRRIKARGMTAGIINNNNRRYKASVLTEAVKEAQTLIAERRLLAESNHPSDKLTGQADILESLVRWDSIIFEGDEVLVEGEIIPTKGKGENLIIIMEHGVYPRLSQRAHGKAEIVEEAGKRFVDITELHITGYDLVMNPGDPTADTLVFESHQPPIHPHKEGIPAMDEVTLEALRKDHPKLVAQIIAEHDAEKRKLLEESLQLEQRKQEQERQIIAAREAALRQELGLGETDDLKEAMAKQQTELKRLQEADQARQVAEYIDKEVGGIKYAELLKKQFSESIKTAAPKTIDEAKAIIIAKRKEYDALQSGLELAARGHGGVSILGPVLERDRGIPDYAKASFALTESLVRSGQTEPRDLRQPKTVNERYTAAYLERFDTLYRHHLIAEARAFEEAETASDLALPYSVARAVMAEALPELVAISIFDVQMTDQAPTTNVWFEAYSAESGATLTVVDEVVVAALGAWVNLANKRLQPGTVVLTHTTGTPTYVEGTDYVVDYANGRLWCIAGTITAAQSLKIDYVSDQIRKGENVAIERAKNVLTSQPLTIAADRLAMQITTEAVVFSRAALGYDAVNRTLMRLVKQIGRKIDSGLFYLALSAGLRVASNSGGTWTAASDSLDLLVSRLGTAKVKVANRFFDPTFILLSKTNSDRLSNWAAFTAAGARPDADLNAAGYVGRAKGLPVFDSANFQDGYILVGNREVVAHRVFQPMQLKGPFPTYSGTQLVGADQYYAEEFNGSETFVPEKTSYVKVV